MTQPEMPPRLTDAQRRAAFAGDRDVWLTAGAGSGKTRVLIERYLHLHLTRSIPLPKILAVTFTDKAASEMRGRIAARLREAARFRSLRELPHAPIGTIDAFCYRLVREYADVAGIDPSLRVLSPVEVRDWEERVWVSLLGRWWRERKADLVLLLQSFPWKVGSEQPGGVDPRPLLSLIRQVRTAGRDLDEISFEPAVDEGPGDGWGGLDEAMVDVKRLLRTDLPEKTREKLERILTLSDVEKLPPEERVRAAVRVRKGIDQSVSRDAKPLMGRAIRLLEAAAARDADLALARPRSLLHEFSRDFHRAFAGEKSGEGVADFLDIEEAARSLLHDPSVRREVRARFPYLLLDECQDTNELQLQIVRLVRTAGRFFAVGDAKQSIYRFRDADVGAFVAMRDGQHEASATEELQDNFRSRPEILRWVNALFPALWVENEAMRLPYEPLQPGEGKSFPPKEDPSIEILQVKGEKAGEAREREAELLAARLKEIHDLQVDDLGYRDMVLLLRSATDMGVYERALRRRGIAAVVAVGRGFFQTREVVDLLVGLRLLEDPYDDIRLASALRSPLVGLEEEDLACLLIGRPQDGSHLWDRLRAGESVRRLSLAGSERSRRFTDLLERLRLLRGRLASHRLLEGLVYGTGYLDSLLHRPDGLRRRANARKLIDLAREMETGGELALPEAIRSLERLRVTHLREPESAVDEERDAVRLLTIHGAKGMEFPLVAVIDLGRKLRPDHPVFLFHKKIGLGVKGREVEPFLYGTIKEVEVAQTGAEEIRLLYVALTRAERHLILSGSYARPAGWLEKIRSVAAIPDSPGPAEILGLPVKVLGSAGKSVSSIPRRIRPSQVFESPKRFARKGDREEGDRIVRRLTSPSPEPALSRSGRTVTEVDRFAVCPRQFQLSRMFPLPAARRQPGAPQPGSAFHELMEHTWRSGPKTPPSIDRFPDEVKLWRERFLALPEMKPVVEAESKHAEVSFFVPVEERPLRGAVDLLVRERRCWHLIDYKTGSKSPEDLLLRYTRSLSLYRLAIRLLLSDNIPVRASVYAVQRNLLLPVPQEGEDQAQEALRRYDRAEVEGRYPAERSNACEPCSYRPGCPAWEPESRSTK